MIFVFRYSIIIAAFLIQSVASAQKLDRMKQMNEDKPTLIVAIIVDQMKQEFLFRFSDRYGQDGFRRLVNEGFVFRNAHFNYTPTYTGPGHASIFTGTYPSVHGIIGNEWYDRNTGNSVYCVGDDQTKPVGTTSISGKMSPRNMLASTFTDQMRLGSNFRSKVIGISLKDRGAVLPAGHTANAAYWHDPHLNNWVSSTYYMKELPQWVKDFNARKISDSLISQPWNTLYPIETYNMSSPDDSPYEGLFKGQTRPVFPHDLPEYKALESELIRKTPFGDTYTRMFAQAAVSGEGLGKRKDTDCLIVSFSTPDYVGHMYGTTAVELEDVYLRFDRELGAFLNFLDKEVGKGKYTLFLTSDHGAAHNVSFLQDNKIPTGNIRGSYISDSLRAFIKRYYNDEELLLTASGKNIFLNRKKIESKKIPLNDIQNSCRNFLLTLDGVNSVYISTELYGPTYSTGFSNLYKNGHHAKRGADIVIQYDPAYLSWHSKTGTSHGSPYAYDTHVPLIFYGKNIPSGTSVEFADIINIASTISTMLNIEFPNGNLGKPLDVLFRQD